MIQHYVIKFVSDLREVGGVFSGHSGFFHQLNTITPTHSGRAFCQGQEHLSMIFISLYYSM